MRKLIYILILFLLFYCFINIFKAKPLKIGNSKDNIISENKNWYNFTNKEIQDAQNVAKKYYEQKNLPYPIETIRYDITTDENGNIYNSGFGSLSQYKNDHSIIFLVNTKDIDGYDQSRLIILTRKNKDANWEVIDEGL